MTRLHQIIALEKGAKAQAGDAFIAAQYAVSRTPQLNGIARTYTPKDDASGDKLPPESTLVQVKVEDVLTKMTNGITALFNMVATKELADTTAFADVKLDDRVLLAHVPVTYLLFLEKQLAGLRTFVIRLPVLDPAERWSPEGNQGVWATDPVQTTRTKKVKRAVVLYEATKEHPAQVQSYDEDEIIGTWNTTKFSGALQQTRVDELVARIDQLSVAVKTAREEANSVEVVDQRYAAEIFRFLLA